MNNLKERFIELENKIKEAETKNQPVNVYVAEQIDILEKSLKEFISEAVKKGYSRDDIKVGEVEIRQYMIISELAAKIGLPTTKYDNLIKQAQIRVLGKEVYNSHFKQ